MVADLLFHFYRVWHGVLRQRGAGWLLTRAATRFRKLRQFPLRYPEGQVLRVDYRDVSSFYLTNHLLGDPFEERGLLSALTAHAGGGAVIWDIGANCGLLSYQLAKSGRFQEVHFFEPNPVVHELAASLLKPFPFVQGHSVALSDEEKKLDLVLPAGASTTATLEADRTNRTGASIEVCCRRGDTMVREGLLPAPSVIKIDTEGHELAVLKGLEGLLRTHKPVVFFEDISLTDEEILQAVPEGYRLHSVCDADGSLHEGIDRSIGHNSVFVPVE